MSEKKLKYKTETWHFTKYKGQKNEYKTNTEVLVKRHLKGTIINGKNVSGRFVKCNNPVIYDIKTKTYGSGFYTVGLANGKVITRHLKARRVPEWYEKRKEAIAARKIYRSSYVLNDIPFRGNVYYGFRIVAFSHNAKYLENLKSKLKDRLIEYIENCVGYRKDEFWFDLYFGYEKPTVSNGTRFDDGKYYLKWTKRFGDSMGKDKEGTLERL